MNKRVPVAAIVAEVLLASQPLGLRNYLRAFSIVVVVA
jgi:hypothetical protein